MMDDFFIVVAIVLAIVIIVPIIFRAKIIRVVQSYKNLETRVRFTRLVLKINIWISVVLGLGISVFITGMGHSSKIDWSFTIPMTLGVMGFLFLISYLAFVSFANKKIIAQIYIWSFCFYVLFAQFFLFPFSTVFGVLVILGQLAWYKIEKESDTKIPLQNVNE
jgi:hypothetical protein